MKKKLTSVFIMFIGALVMFSGCKKETLAYQSPIGLEPTNHNQPSDENPNYTTNSFNSSAFTFIEDYLSFKNIQDYENLINDSSKDKESDVAAYLRLNNFVDYFSNAGSRETMDDFLGLLLNPEGVIQIGEHIFRLDPANNTVLAILAAEKSLYFSNLLAGNIDQVHVIGFSMEDEVLDLIQGTFSEACSGSQGFNRETAIITSVNGQNLVGGAKFQTKYLKLGIYFSVRVKVFQYGGPGNIYPNDIDFKFDIKTPDMRLRKKPCNSGSEIVHASGLRYFDATGFWSMDGIRRVKTWKGYEGIKGLNGYRVWVRGYINNNLAHTDWLGRQQNY